MSRFAYWMLMLFLFGIAFFGLLLAFAVHQKTQAHPREIECASFLENPPARQRLRVSGCIVDATNFITYGSILGSEFTELIVLLRNPESDDQQPAKAVHFSSDSELLALTRRMKRLTGDSDEVSDQARRFVERHDGALYRVRPIEGFVVPSDTYDSTSHQTELFRGRLATEFVTVSSEGEDWVYIPMGISATLTALLLMLIVTLADRRWTKRRCAVKKKRAARDESRQP